MPPKLKLFLELLEKGSLPLSRFGNPALKELRTPLWSGLLMEHGRGAGRVISVLKPDVFRTWIQVKFPGAFEPVPEAAPRIANLAMARDSKRGRRGLDHYAVSARAHAIPDGLPDEARATLACIVDATRRFGATTLHLGVPGAGRERPDPTLPPGLRLMTIENPTNFDHSETVRGEADVFLLGGSGGRMRESLVEWLAEQDPAEVIHFGDYDPVGLQEFGRIARRLPGKARFYLPEDLERLFQVFSNRGLMEADNNRAIMASLNPGVHPSADRILDLINRYGPLEQEALLVPM